MSTTKQAAAAKKTSAKAGAPRTRRSERKVTASATAKPVEQSSKREQHSASGQTASEQTASEQTAVAAPAKPSVLAKRDGVMTEMSEAWYQMARGGQTASLDALRKFVDVVVPLQGGDESRRRKLINGAFDLADRAGAAQLGLARGALQNSVLVYVDVGVDVDVNVDTDVDAFTGVDVGVDVNVPTDVGAFKHASQF